MFCVEGEDWASVFGGGGNAGIAVPGGRIFWFTKSVVAAARTGRPAPLPSVPANRRANFVPCRRS